MADSDSTLHKKCRKCFEVKLLSEFYRGKLEKDGFRNQCKACENKLEKERRSRPEILQRLRESCRVRYEKKNGNRKSGDRKKRRAFSENKKVEVYQRFLEWKAENPDRYREMKRKERNKPLVKFQTAIRSSIRKSLNKKGYEKISRTTEILGCTWPEFKRHIERQFVSGMSWDVMGSKIHIDHIVPLATAKTEEEILLLNRFTNLRPMWAIDNLKKSSQITHLI